MIRRCRKPSEGYSVENIKTYWKYDSYKIGSFGSVKTEKKINSFLTRWDKNLMRCFLLPILKIFLFLIFFINASYSDGKEKYSINLSKDTISYFDRCRSLKAEWFIVPWESFSEIHHISEYSGEIKLVNALTEGLSPEILYLILGEKLVVFKKEEENRYSIVTDQYSITQQAVYDDARKILVLNDTSNLVYIKFSDSKNQIKKEKVVIDTIKSLPKIYYSSVKKKIVIEAESRQVKKIYERNLRGVEVHITLMR